MWTSAVGGTLEPEHCSPSNFLLKDCARTCGESSAMSRKERSSLVIGPVRVALGGVAHDVIAPKKRRVALAMENAADLTFTQDLKTYAGNISIEGNIPKVQDFLKLAAAMGRQVNHGWELTGQATAVTQWGWKEPFKGHWNGLVSVNKGSLTVAGLNQPLKLEEARLGW